MLKLHQFHRSPFCDKVRRALHLKGQAFEVVDVPLTQAPLRLRRLNPAGKVPVLEHDGRVVSDSSDILLYLEELFPDPPLFPLDPRERALCHMLEDWADESLYFYEVRLRLTFPHNAERWVPELLAHDAAPMRLLGKAAVPRVASQMLDKQGLGRKSEAQILAETQRHLDALVDWLANGDWLVGQAISAADLAVFAQLDALEGTEEGGRMIGARPALEGWMDRVRQATG